MNLDKRLQEILDEFSLACDIGLMPEDETEAITAIHKAIDDAGYIRINTDCPHRFNHNKDELGHEGETCERCGIFRHMAKNDDIECAARAAGGIKDE